jgi:hypothetical protein
MGGTSTPQFLACEDSGTRTRMAIATALSTQPVYQFQHIPVLIRSVELLCPFFNTPLYGDSLLRQANLKLLRSCHPYVTFRSLIVLKERLELSRLSTLVPKTSVSTIPPLEVNPLNR